MARVEVGHADHRQHRPEQLLAGGAGLGVGEVEDRRAELRTRRRRRRRGRRARAARPPRRRCAISPSRRSRDGGETTGQTSVAVVEAGADAQRPGPVDDARERGVLLLRRADEDRPPSRPGSAGPAPPKAERETPSTIRSGRRRASRSSSSWRRRAPGRACRWRSRAPRRTGDVAEPTNEIASTPGESSRALTASWAPCTRLTTPGGMASTPAISSTMRSGASGSCSDGFSTNVLPQTTRVRDEPERHHRREVERRDRRHDAHRLVEPSPRRSPRETPSSTSPFSRCGAAMAASTDSMPRPTSAKASGTVLPMSVATRRASSSWCATSTWRRSMRARARARIGVAAHPG